MTIVAETERLVIRLMEEGDAPFVRDLLNEPSFLHFIGDRQVRTVEEAAAYISEVFAASYRTFGFGLYWVGLKDGTPVGLCGLVKREALPDVDVGFAFLERHWGRGYAVEAGRAVLAHAYDGLGLRRVVGITAPDNTASMAVLRKLGLKHEGPVVMPGYDIDRELFVPG